jgi:NADPH2:quinone reductase
MKAIQMTEVGAPEVLQLSDLEEPKIETDSQLKVRLKAAGVNPIDYKLRCRGVFYPDALPTILGCDGAGVVEEQGGTVTRFKPGDEVWFCNGGLGREQGNYAEYTLVEAAIAQPKPRSLTFVEAAAAPLVLITAWEALYDHARLKHGQTVLIHAGAGGVGHVAIQLAKLAGASVCTTVGSKEKADFVKDLGADEIILYRETDFINAVNDWTDGQGVDIALDTLGGETFHKTMSAMAYYGDLVTLLDPGRDVDWKEARHRNLRIAFELMLTPMLQDLPSVREHQGEILQRCGQWCDEGRLKIQVGHTFPLEKAVEAHRLLEEGHMQGKIVLTLND